MIILLPALLCIYFAIRMGVNLYGNLRFPCIYLSNHREILTTYHYDSPMEISRSTNYISDYVVYINTSTYFILTIERDHHVSAETLEIFIKDLTKRLCPSLGDRFVICIGKSNKDKITSWKNFVDNVRISREYLSNKLDIQTGFHQENERRVKIHIYG